MTVIAVPVDPDGSVGHSWGKAEVVAVVTVSDGHVERWVTHEVGWDLAHDSGTHGSHHARVIRFLRDHDVQVVLVRHVGEGMRRMLTSAGIDLREGVGGDARTAVLAAAAG